MAGFPLSTAESRPWHIRLHDLMPFRVREILLVSSDYDAFILEEDGPLTERMFVTYSELNLTWSPRITHVPNAARALAILQERRFDLVIAMPRLEDAHVADLAEQLKAQDPYLAVVVLTFSEADLLRLPEPGENSAIDHVFLWTGDARILITVSKLIEDQRNIDNDTALMGVPVILVVEDSVRSYSQLLTELYAQLMVQSQSLIADGVNNLQKLLRMRTRPKVVHAASFEQATAAAQRLGEHLLALVSDVRFSRAGKTDPQAGLLLIEHVRQRHSDLPILLQSAETTAAKQAAALGVGWVDKNSPDLAGQLQKFVNENLGFGDFVFRLPDRTEVGRARDRDEMEKALLSVPLASLIYHASHNHFSGWLRARGMFDVADVVRTRQVKDFDEPEDLRQFLIEMVRSSRVQDQAGVIADVASVGPGLDNTIMRVGQGSIGGKARGVAFVNHMLANGDLPGHSGDLRIAMPRSVVIGTGEFDRFLQDNELPSRDPNAGDDYSNIQRFLRGSMHEQLVKDLRAVWPWLRGPLAVRSSSLLEDLQFQPFSGIYFTYMLPNNHPDENVRFDELCRAIKAVWASTFSENARAYIANTAFRAEDEKMAILLQEMVGQESRGRFYPTFSGVALSCNYYPIHHQRAEDGTAVVALGLGHTVVTGGTALRFSPSSPGIMPQFKSDADFLRCSQKAFYALDLTHPKVDFLGGPEASLGLYDLSAAEEDGSLALVGSVFSRTDNAIRDSLHFAGPRVVTFNNVLKWQSIPLAVALRDIMRAISQGTGCPVEVEFAVDLGAWGRTLVGNHARHEPTLYILQVRPLPTPIYQRDVGELDPPDEMVLCRTERALGHGVLTEICDVVYVKLDALDRHPTAEVAQQIGWINKTLFAAKRPFLLVGPGRWGSSDARLGIPVEWRQISGARVIAETKLQGREVEPSQGTHFFQNITSLGVGYLTLQSTRREPRGGPGFIDSAWLDAQPAEIETSAVRAVHFSQPLCVYLNGRKGSAMILKPGVAATGQNGIALQGDA